MRLAILTTFAVLIGCGSPSAPTSTGSAVISQPGIAYLKGSNGPNVISAELQPFTNVGIVESLGVTFVDRGQTSARSGRVVITTDAGTFAGVRQAAASGASAPGLTQAATQVARATFCRTGPVMVHRIRPNPAGRGVQVNMSCNAPTPYGPTITRSARSTGPTAAELQGQIVGKTILAVSEAHGTQVEYVAANGTAHLWYPGNTRVNQGTWRTRTAPGPRANWTEICFDFGAGSVNPVTRTRGVESCTPAQTFLLQTTDIRDGDIFNLASGAIPFVLPRRTAYSFRSLQNAI